MSLKKKQWIFVRLGLCCLLYIPQLAIGESSKEITAKELYDHIVFLSSDELKGRKPGSPEADIAADYIRDQFESYGLQLLGDNGFQTLEVLKAIDAGEKNLFQFNQHTGELFKDFTPINFSANGSVSASCVFVGYGFDFNSDSLSWHDYEDVDVAGKWAMILRDAPESDGDRDFFRPYRSLRKKVLVAKDEGATGVLFVSGETFDNEDGLVSLRDNPSISDAGILVLHIKRSMADLLLRNSEITIADLETQLNENRQPTSFMIKETVTAHVQLHKQMSPTHNVVAMLSGKNAQLKNEHVVLGAHYDHLGMGGPGSGSRRPDTLAVHNGADDNASGVAALLEIAQKLATATKELDRSIIFTAFTAEEMGTLGSRYFTDNPLVDLNNMTLMINMDMIGRLDDSTKAFNISGTGTALGLEEMVKDAVKKYGLHPTLNPEGYGPSDHAPFYNSNIPVLSFMTSIHEDYHTPEDDFDKINAQGEKIIADFICEMTMEIANRPERLAYQEAGPKAPPPMGRRFKVTLGIMPDFISSGTQGLRAEAVLPGRPAARAGMQKGDIIISMEGKPVKDIYEYMNRLADFRVGQRISVEVVRDGQKHILIVEL
ncbi:M20/M25/M40 family metallo-hydrolase [candidate division KSB1 bacterium]|nr:M20/M25/M40 family metallo-hydrolase [candidate division KSB1 bacterium]